MLGSTGQKQGLCHKLGHFVLLGCMAQYLGKVLGGRDLKILSSLLIRPFDLEESPSY